MAYIRLAMEQEGKRNEVGEAAAQLAWSKVEIAIRKRELLKMQEELSSIEAMSKLAELLLQELSKGKQS